MKPNTNTKAAETVQTKETPAVAPAATCSLSSLIAKFEGQATLSEGKAGWVASQKDEPEISFHTLHMERARVWQFCADCLKEISSENAESIHPESKPTDHE